MDSDSWSAHISSLSRRYQSSLQSRADLYLGFEEIDCDDDDDIREEYPCPFCSEYYDIVGLCCHIDDEHPTEANNGVCPVCAIKVGVDMVAHITLQHGNIFKMQRKRKSCKNGSQSTLSLLRKELREGNLQSLFGGSSFIVSSNNAAPDPLSSFILPMCDELVNSECHSSADTMFPNKGKDENTLERSVQSPPLSIKDQRERARRSGFIHEVLLSTIFENKL